MRAICSSLRNGIRQSHTSTASRRSFSSRASLSLWNGGTQPYENQKIVNMPLPVHGQVIASTTSPSSAEKTIEAVHQKFVEDLLSRATASAGEADTQASSQDLSKRPGTLRQRTRQHSLSEPALFRTDGPLTPYPIELDSGELVEPKHATMVRIVDKGGEERTIIVAEVEDESGKQRRVLFAVDLERNQGQGGGNDASIQGKKVTAEDTYATLGLETQNTRS